MDINIDASGNAQVVGATIAAKVTTAHRIAPLVVLLTYGAVFV
jgi:hypothetical protein